jgi:RNA polymerase sigma-70 factor (ECF subfamily)
MAMEKKSAQEIEKLVRQAKSGDAEAFGEVYDRLVVAIYRYIYYRVSKTEVEDLTETVFLKAWEKRQSYRKQAGNSFTSWLYRIAHNVVVDYYRAKSKTDNVELSEDLVNESEEIDPNKNAQRNFDQTDLAYCIRRLPSLQQQVIILKFVNGLTNEEIAEITGKNVGALRVIQHRALAALKEILESRGKYSRNVKAILAFKTMQDV